MTPEPKCPYGDCREELIGRIADVKETAMQRVKDEAKGLEKRKINGTTFWAGTSVAVVIIVAAVGIAYNAYAGRMDRMEDKQDKIEASQQQQEKDTAKINTTVEVIKTNQDHVKDEIKDVKELLKRLLRQNRGVSTRPDPSGDNGD